MKMDYMTIFGILLLLNGIAANSLPGCINDKYISIEEDSRDPVICDGVESNQSVTWLINGEDWSGPSTLGECEPSATEVTCSNSHENVTITRSATQSILTILRNHRDFGQAFISCGRGYYCQMRIIRSATLTMCNVFVRTVGPADIVLGSCYIEKTFASDHNYMCHWQFTYPNTNDSARLASAFITTPYTADGRVYYKSTCAFSNPVFTVNGTYTFYINFSPGPVQQVGTLEIPYTVDKQQVIAKPLTFPATDTNQLVLTCNSAIKIDTHTWTGVTCTGGNENPTCSFTPDPPEDEGKVITCSVYLLEQPFIGSTVNASFILNIRPTAPVITGYQPEQVLSVGETLIMTCSVSASDSVVPPVIFYCGMRIPDEDDTRNGTHISSQVNISVLPGDNGTLCLCKYAELALSSNVTLIVKENPSEETTTKQNEHENTQRGDSPGEDKESTPSPFTAGGKEDGSLPVASIGGGVAAAIVVIVGVVIIVVVIMRRRKGSQKGTGGQQDNELVEHNNILYEPGDSPYEVNDAYQPASSESTIQKQPAATTVDPTYEDHNLDSCEDGYAAVSTGSSQGKGKHPQSQVDHDLYSYVDAPTHIIPAGPTIRGDEYAVVDKSKKRNTEPKLNKSRPKTGGDVYAQVNKPAKRANPSPMQQAAGAGDGKYGEVQNSKPDLKPKPALKPKPTAAVKLNPKSTSGPVETSGGDDEYNVLRFQGRNSDTPANPDAGQLYSHIGSDV